MGLAVGLPSQQWPRIAREQLTCERQLAAQASSRPLLTPGWLQEFERHALVVQEAALHLLADKRLTLDELKVRVRSRQSQAGRCPFQLQSAAELLRDPAGPSASHRESSSVGDDLDGRLAGRQRCQRPEEHHRPRLSAVVGAQPSLALLAPPVTRLTTTLASSWRAPSRKAL